MHKLSHTCRHLANATAILGAALALPAFAEDGFTVVDSHRQSIGPQIDLYDLGHQYAGKWYTLNFDANGFHQQAIFYFASNNCTGQKWVPQNLAIPPMASYDGSQIWAGDPRGLSSLHPASYQWGGHCFPDDPTYAIPVDPAVVIDSNPARWVPPFSVR